LRALHFLNQLAKYLGTLGMTFLIGVLLLAIKGGQGVPGGDEAGAGLADSLILTGDAIRAGAVAVAQKPPMGLLS